MLKTAFYKLAKYENAHTYAYLGVPREDLDEPGNKKEHKENVAVSTIGGAIPGTIGSGLVHRALRGFGESHLNSAKYSVPFFLATAGLGAYNSHNRAKLNNAFVDQYHGKGKISHRELIDKVLSKKSSIQEYLLKIAAPISMSEGELGALGKIYKASKHKYKNIISKYKGKEQEVHDAVKTHIKEPKTDFFEEHGIPKPPKYESNFGRERNHSSDDFARAWEDMGAQHAERQKAYEDEFKKTEEKIKNVFKKHVKQHSRTIAGIGAVGGLAFAYGLKKEKDNFKKKYPKVKI